jgi:hypothetical protein
MKTYFFFTDWVYSQDYLVVIALNNKDFIKIVKKELGVELEPNPQAAGQFHGYEAPKGQIGIIWVRDLNDTLIHESCHATSWALQSRGILPDSQSGEEAWAYYLTFLVSHIRANAQCIKQDAKEKKHKKGGKENV